MTAGGIEPQVHLGRLRTPLPHRVGVKAPLSVIAGRVPWRLVEGPALRRLETQFRRAVDAVDPATTVAWFWPGSPVEAVAHARDRGLLTVREMVNSPMAASGPILDAAYARAGLPPTHGVTTEAIADETAELPLYDYIFASNPEVERGLAALGVPRERVLPTSFGWSPARFAGTDSIPRSGFRAVFVGSIGVRKGVVDLLRAWERADVDGELLLVGRVDPTIADLVDEHVAAGRIRLYGYAANPAAVYRGSDLFVFPTLEEGGPQVTYEAAGCGLAVITTPMGAARLVQDGRTGIVVNPGDPDALAVAIRTLADDAVTRRAYGDAARAAAADFAYSLVGARRGAQLMQILRERASR